MPAVNTLPFDPKLGYPQKQLVKINNKAYRLFYRWNYQGNFAVLRIRRIEDDTIVFEGKLVEKNPFEIKDPSTYENLFVILPWNINEKEVEVWVFG